MIFYKSVANVRQNVKKNDPKEKLANHYANIPSKIKAYIRRPVEGHSKKSQSRSKSKDKTETNNI
jgi:hypothetical protein